MTSNNDERAKFMNSLISLLFLLLLGQIALYIFAVGKDDSKELNIKKLTRIMLLLCMILHVISIFFSIYATSYDINLRNRIVNARGIFNY